LNKKKGFLSKPSLHKGMEGERERNLMTEKGYWTIIMNLKRGRRWATLKIVGSRGKLTFKRFSSF